GDGLEAALVHATESAIQSALARPTAANTTASNHSIGTGSVPALQAAETGASSTATDERMIETRCVVNRNGTTEATIEHFFSRAALVGKVHINDTGTTGKGFDLWDIDVMGYVQLRRKLELFTYMRFNAEFTFVTTTHEGKTPECMLQFMYIPPGAPHPDTRDAFQWQTSTNPSVFAKMSDPPAQVSVPFMSPASAYQWFYDGYPTFGDHSGDDSLRYGQCPNNMLGTFAIRVVSENVSGYNFTTRVYMKLKHIRAWVPRPLRSQPYILKNYPNYDGQNIHPASHNRSTITTT
nr:capsid protein VP1 [enterovirus A114]